MPKRVDHEQRRAVLAAALWRIAARDGLASTTVRQVAAEAGVSVGMVQHYFATKDQMLTFALQRIGDDLGARITRRIAELPEPRDPYQVVRIVLFERLPTTPERRVHVQVLVAWLGRIAINPELTEYLAEGTTVLREHIAAQLRAARELGAVYPHVDPDRAADGLLAFGDGLASHLIQNLHTADSAEEVLDAQLALLFRRSA